MNRLMLAAALAALFGSEAQAQTSTPGQIDGRQWSASFTAGGYDLLSHFVGGTEIRQFAVWNAASTTYSSSPTSGPKLFAANGYTQDHPGPEGTKMHKFFVSTVRRAWAIRGNRMLILVAASAQRAVLVLHTQARWLCLIFLVDTLPQQS